MHEYIESYVHANKIGVLVHLSCNDSFSLRTTEFTNLARDLAMHIAASKPIAITPSGLDPAIRNGELAHYQEAMKNLEEEERIAKMEEVNRRINEQFCLFEQPFVKNPDIKVGHLIDSVSEELRDHVKLLRFVRWAENEI